jgi:hypothetical protein
MKQTIVCSNQVLTFWGLVNEQKLAGEFMRAYVWIAVGRVGSTVESIQQSLLLASPGKKPR